MEANQTEDIGNIKYIRRILAQQIRSKQNNGEKIQK